MKIPIPELEERFNSIDEALYHIILYCDVIVEKAKKICSSVAISDIPGYALEFCRKTLVQATTLVKVAQEREDYNTVCSLVRIIADNVSTIRLIYCTEDKEEKILRHLLYVMDGVSTRYEYLKDYPKAYDGSIPRKTYEELCAQVYGAKDNAQDCIAYCIKEIKALVIYSTQQTNIDKLIKSRNWKFKTIDKPKKDDAYKWHDMYQLLGIKEKGAMFSYFSQYVHGLSISNIAFSDKEDFEPPLAFAVSLVGWLFNYLRKEYEPYIGNYTREDLYKMIPELYYVKKNNFSIK